VSTPTGPDDIDGTGPVPGDGALDDLDALVLERLDALHERLDGPPPGFADLMVFAVAAHGLDVELARLEDGVLAARGDEEVARSLTFEAESLSVLLRVADAGDDRVRLDGWLAPATSAEVVLRSPGGAADRTVGTDVEGRFVVEGLPHGLVQLVVRPGATSDPGAGPVVTPTFEL
jgi:hypothetical protein